MPGVKLQTFLEWCQQRGLSSDGLEIRSCKESGNGVFAKRFFRANEKLIELPKEMMITAGKVADIGNYSKILSETKFFPTPFELLTLFFCIEDAKSSLYAPYINVLPKSFTTPSYIKKTIDAADLPLSAREYWCIQQKDLQNTWIRIHKVLPQLSYEKFLWAWHVVNTRCIYVENKPHTKVDNSLGDTLAVIPFVDMLNHDPCAKGLAMFDSYSNKYVVQATHCVVEGQELTICYGPHDNARLWMEYGFTLQNNPFGKVIVDTALFIELAKSVGIAVSSQHEQALYSAGLPCTLYLSDEGPSWALQANMKILMLSSSDIKRWRELIYKEDYPQSLSVCSTDDRDQENDVKHISERHMLEKIIIELKKGVTAKLIAAPEDTKWIWNEQLTIIDAILSSFIH